WRHIDRGSARRQAGYVRPALPRLCPRSRRQQALRAPSHADGVRVEILSENKSHGGRQLVVKHSSAVTSTDITFSIHTPPQAESGERIPVCGALPGLPCTHAHVTEKGEYRAACAEHGLIFVAPDTSPRGDNVPDDNSYDFGKGAGFYVDATEEPWA